MLQRAVTEEVNLPKETEDFAEVVDSDAGEYLGGYFVKGFCMVGFQV